MMDHRYEVLGLMNHNNLRPFIDTMSLSSRQIWWAQELLWYYFRINYCQGRINITADSLSCFSYYSQNKEEKLQIENP